MVIRRAIEEQQYFYSKKDRYHNLLQLRELDGTTVKYFIGNNFVFDVVENFKYDEEERENRCKKIVLSYNLFKRTSKEF